MRQHRGKWFRQRPMATLHIWLLIGLIPAFVCLGQTLADAADDDFNDNKKGTTKWGTDEVKGHGHLNETKGHLEYTCGTGTARDSSDRPWILNRFPYDADWTIQIDATNNTSPSGNQYSSFGINVRSAIDQDNEIEVELEAYPGGASGFLAEFHYYGVPYGYAEQLTGSKFAPIRVSFNSTTKVLTVLYYDGSQWVDFGSFGVAGSGGANSNADWGLTDADQFIAYVFGYSENMAVSDGQLYGDNFVETGGVTPIPIAPGPTGTFWFRYNPLLTAIVSVTGNYEGVSPYGTHRSYDIDIAQDESGKLSAISTVDGILNKDGNSEISGNVGTVKTVNGEPTAQLKTPFTGTRDGTKTTLSGTATVPVKVTDVGGGTQGIAGTGSYRAKVGDVPVTGKNVPIQVAAPPGAVGNLKKDWTLQLDITGKQDARGKTYIVASSQLVLPNGETIVFPERRTRYSTKTGYSLSFTGGTNVSVNPQKVDRRTSILIKGMTLVKQSNVWQPTGGTITYKFFGQRGSGNLLDFIVLP
ncbi:MAG: hypothetical protein ACXU9L_04960 [Thermodesulfobacteriota bacterium]